VQEAVVGVVALIGAAAGVTTLVLWFWLFIHAYAELDRNDPNSWWLVISTRYRRLGLTIVALYVTAFTLLMSATILQKFLRE
jgi:hypothetical protein